MKLLTKALLEQIPPLYATEGEKDPMVWTKFSYADHPWSWYVIEFDGKETFFGFVDGDFPELGYFPLADLLANPGGWRLPIERDRYFEPCRLSHLRAQLGR